LNLYLSILQLQKKFTAANQKEFTNLEFGLPQANALSRIFLSHLALYSYFRHGNDNPEIRGGHYS
jgi:hypothetical protein